MTTKNKNKSLAPPMTAPSVELAKELRISSERLADMYSQWSSTILKRAPTVSERITLALSLPFFQDVARGCRAELASSTTSAQRKSIGMREATLSGTIASIQEALDLASDRDIMLLA
jgi:hypothetical protein